VVQIINTLKLKGRVEIPLPLVLLQSVVERVLDLCPKFPLGLEVVEGVAVEDFVKVLLEEHQHRVKVLPVEQRVQVLLHRVFKTQEEVVVVVLVLLEVMVLLMVLEVTEVLVYHHPSVDLPHSMQVAEVVGRKSGLQVLVAMVVEVMVGHKMPMV